MLCEKKAKAKAKASVIIMLMFNGCLFCFFFLFPSSECLIIVMINDRRERVRGGRRRREIWRWLRSLHIIDFIRNIFIAGWPTWVRAPRAQQTLLLYILYLLARVDLQLSFLCVVNYLLLVIKLIGKTNSLMRACAHFASVTKIN